MATAGELIKDSLQLLGALASGEEPEASEYEDGLKALAQMLDSWSTERLTVYGTQEHIGTWPAGEDSLDIGVNGAGAFGVNPGPIRIDPSTYYVVNGVSYPITLINEAQYNSISVKTTQGLPEVMWANMVLVSDTNIRMTLWPVPSQDLEFHVVCVKELTQPTATGDTLYFPAGYLRAIKYNLAVEIAPWFGVEPSKTIRRVASDSRRNIRRINNPDVMLNLPLPLMGRGWYNIQTDSSQ